MKKEKTVIPSFISQADILIVRGKIRSYLGQKELFVYTEDDCVEGYLIYTGSKRRIILKHILERRDAGEILSQCISRILGEILMGGKKTNVRIQELEKIFAKNKKFCWELDQFQKKKNLLKEKQERGVEKEAA